MVEDTPPQVRVPVHPHSPSSPTELVMIVHHSHASVVLSPQSAARGGLPSEKTTLSVPLKRALDVPTALLLLAALGPLMLLIAVLIRVTSPGPALYTQTRVGRRGRRFRIYKFRTMHDEAESATGPVWSHARDPRQTSLGWLLRRLSIDELPQLINVVKGDMSLIGPRPERPIFVDRFQQRLEGYEVRHEMLPGITGLAQVNGWRGDTSIQRRLQYDVYYVQHWSPLLDARVLAQTPLEILRGLYAS